ncbi:MAG: nitroreductase family protein [Planctomycetes bacterium]|nr:nitroreductase family protein [Planctomycetota bacterium]
MVAPTFLPHDQPYVPPETPERAAQNLHAILARRRSVRQFSDRAVSLETMQWLVRCACSAPSGANKQPWRFICVQNPDLKRQIRHGAEAEERALYEHRASEQWLKDLEPLGTDANKEFLEIAPWLVVVFKLNQTDDGGRVYYAEQSIGIATGMFLAAAQVAGLATLTHTPSPMAFLGPILDRPEHEKPYMLIPVGFPADDCEVPAHAVVRRPLAESMVIDRPKAS